MLCDLVPGGHPKEIYAAQAARILERTSPSGAVALARAELAAAVRVSRTTLTDFFGVGPVVAGTIIGDIGDASRFPGPHHFAACNGTAPVEVSSGNRKVHRLSLRGNRRINHAIHMAAITQLRYKHSPAVPTTTRKSARESPTRRRCGLSSGGSATPSSPASRPTPARAQRPRQRAREGNRGTTLTPARPAHTPNAGSSDKPLPDLPQAYGPPREPGPPRRRQVRSKPGQPLDTNSKEDSLCAAG